ncbi:hypothetical protein MYAM1_003793 [Malassezia yamatoensis]|uniref:Uncharacterized protein n=1 Tax=Malassezia yamatoensis TaxID=253288 RepID=A0AAJ5Z0L8_9BASI|nr:hypothetical protein MYAM1_003793 [Malassezia yamatoensis]
MERSRGANEEERLGIEMPVLDVTDLMPPMRFLSPTELARRGSLQWSYSTYSSVDNDDADDFALETDYFQSPSDNEDDTETMEHLMAAKQRLDALALCDAKDTECVPEFLFCDDASQGNISGRFAQVDGKPRSRSNVETCRSGALQRRRNRARKSLSNLSLPDLDLRLDLTCVPFPTHIDAERNRMQDATKSPAGDTNSTSLSSARDNDQQRPVPPHALEPEEWHWTPRSCSLTKPWLDPTKAPDASYGQPNLPTTLSTAEAEWSWALSPSPACAVHPESILSESSPRSELTIPSSVTTSVQ